MRLAGAALLLGLALANGLPAAAHPAPPRVTSVSRLEDLPTPLPRAYDERADAHADLAAAQARARAEHKRLLIDLGGNWCGPCRIFAAVMALPEVRGFVDEHYVVVAIDVGRFDRNLDIPAAFGVRAVTGIPTVLIVDERGRVLNRQHLDDVTADENMTPQRMANWLARWAD